MANPQKVSIEQIVSAYRTYGTVWKAAKELGICGQSVWERLKAINHPMGSQKWTPQEMDELALLSQSCTISDIANRLGRPYYGVAIKLSRSGLANRYGSRQPRKIPRGAGFNKTRVIGLTRELEKHEGSLRQFCKMNSVSLEMFVRSMQRYTAEFWIDYSAKQSDLEEMTCSYCGAGFYPMTKKQITCTRKCADTKRKDDAYFGGKRRNTVGLSDGICQLCNQEKPKGLSSHHVLGKENDPDNACLVALCPGCHQLVGQLAGRRFADLTEGWENLIQLVMARRMAEKANSMSASMPVWT